MPPRYRKRTLRVSGYLAAAVMAWAAPVRAATESVLHSFGQVGEGSEPTAPLVFTGGKFYGTTAIGGHYTRGRGSHCPSGCGTVFSLTLDGPETMLHEFQGGVDGANPIAGLVDIGGSSINLGGALVGTTSLGGGLGLDGGTIFSITPAGETTQVFAFHKPIGARPSGALVRVGARLFGVTSGVSYPAGLTGSVYLVMPNGEPRRIHAFGGSGDGMEPNGGLLNVGGTLYGTTMYGGAHGKGTVFAITPAGQEVVLNSFDDPDGVYPNGDLANVNGMLFGTTKQGGGTSGLGSGTVFKMLLDGTLTVLSSFRFADGGSPFAGLTRVHNLLYGTTNGGPTNNYGTVFSVTQTGVKRIVHTFQGGIDGRYPESSLLNVGGVLYGTTPRGGTSDAGTVFKIVP